MRFRCITLEATPHITHGVFSDAQAGADFFVPAPNLTGHDTQMAYGSTFQLDLRNPCLLVI